MCPRTKAVAHFSSASCRPFHMRYSHWSHMPVISPARGVMLRACRRTCRHCAGESVSARRLILASRFDDDDIAAIVLFLRDDTAVLLCRAISQWRCQYRFLDASMMMPIGQTSARRPEGFQARVVPNIFRSERTRQRRLILAARRSRRTIRSQNTSADIDIDIRHRTSHMPPI